MSLKSLTRQNYVNKSINNSTTPSGISAPVISSIIICDSNYTNLDDTALSPSGSYVKLIGSGFKTGCTVYFNNETVTATFVSSSEVRIQTPATTVGAYNLMLFNPLNAGGAIYLNLSVSSYPSYTTSSGSLGTYYEANTISNTIVATGDTPLSYSLYSGSLPDGASLNSDGTITGTSPLEGGSTTYSFVVNVKDAQGQDATRSFSLTINTDPVTWTTPTSNQVITAYEYKPISNVTLLAATAAGKTVTYSANTLPGGITLSDNTIYGTNNTVGNTYTRLTATAATTGRTSTRDVVFNVAPDIVTWNTPTENYTISGYEYAPISNVTANATSAAGFGVLYSANTIATGISLNVSSGLISGTPTTVGNTYATLTATANTTSRTNTRNIVYTVNQDVVTFTNPSSNDSTISLTSGDVMSNVVLNATSAAGFGVQYSVQNLPTGVSLSGNTIYGTPSDSGVTVGTVTATANTTNRSTTYYVNWSISIAADAYFKNTGLLLSADSTIQSPIFISDSSNNSSQLSIVGDVKPSNFNPYQNGYYSYEFDGASYLTDALPSSITIGTSDFSFEAWGYWTSFNYGTYGAPLISLLSAAGTSELMIRATKTSASSTTANFFSILTGSTYIPSSMYTSGVSGGTLYLNRWHHLAVSRVSGVWSFYVDGVRYSTTSTGDASLSAAFTNAYIGSDGTGGGGYMSGYVSNVRLMVGSAAYSGASFTVPTAPLLPNQYTRILTAQSSSFKENGLTGPSAFTASSTAIKVQATHPFSTVYQSGEQYYSYNFDGTGDYLNKTLSPAVSWTNSTYTLEAWVFPKSLAADSCIFSTDNGNSRGLMLGIKTDGSLTTDNQADGASIGLSTGSAKVLINQWNHVAITRSGSTITYFINGTSSGTSSTATYYDQTSNKFIIGATTAIGKVFNGIISNLRFVTGSTVYTGNFTPSTTPLTAITGTQVLTCQDSTIKDNSTNAHVITANADAKPLAVSPFTPSSYTNTEITTYGSGYFDGSSDVLTLPAGQLGILGTQSFTMEAWVYTNTIATGSAGIFDMWNGGTTAFLLRRSGSTLQFYVSGGSSVASATLVANTWTHVAAVRNGTTVSLYINGVSVGTPLTSYSTSISSTAALGIGAAATTGNESWSGYISNARIVVGTALYTSNFVPQFTSPLSNITNTQLLTLQYKSNLNNNIFKDQSSFNNLITRSGNATNGTFSPYGDNFSVYTSDRSYLSIPTNSNYDLISTDFTLECWFMPMAFNTMSGSGNNMFGNGLSTGNSGWALGFSGSGTTVTSIDYQVYNGGWQTNTMTTSIQFGTWNHIALVRNGSGAGNLSLYLNGVLQGTAQNQKTYSLAGGTFTLGSGAYTQNGTYSGNAALYLSNVRISKSVVYSSGFTPPTSPLTNNATTVLLMCQSNRYVDNSMLNGTVTSSTHSSTYASIQKFSPFSNVTVSKYYSTKFDGTGDYLQTPASSATSLLGGTGAITNTSTFTIECWIYQTQRQTYDYGCMIGDMGTNGSIYWGFGPNASGKLALRWSDGSTKTAVGNDTIPLNTWTHIALSIDSGAIKLFVNGVLQTITGSTTTTNQVGTLGYLMIGGFYTFSTTYGYYGNISNLRITKSALYSSTFTPSTTPLTVVANTSLLTCQNNTIIDNSTNYHVLSVNGDAKSLPLSPFTTTSNTGVNYSTSVFGGSMYFDGTGDKLTIANYPSLSFKSNDFTIQCWFYTKAASTEQVIMTNGWASYAPWLMRINSSNQAMLNMSLNGASWYVSEAVVGTVVPGQWYHFAVSRSNGVLRAFLNGVQGYTTDLTTNALYDGSQALTIGGRSDTSVPMNGYISDAQLINGVGLYSGNFYPGESPALPTGTVNGNKYSSTLLLDGTSGGVIDVTRTSNLETVGDTKVTNFSPYNGNYYSTYFDGTGDYLTLPNSSAFAFGTGDFTVEMWINTTDTGAGLISQAVSGGWAITIYGSTIYWQSAYNATNLWTYSATNIIDGKWHHLAFSRASGSTKFYVDGVLVATNADSTNYSATTGNIVIGEDANPADLLGHISNLRVVKGTALYTSAFTPSTTPLTAVSGTSLLTCQSNKFVDNSTNNYTITRNGNVRIAAPNPFQVNTGLSYYFDGTGDYLLVPYQNAQWPDITQTTNFTIECWIFVTQYSTGQGTVCGTRLNGSAGWELRISSTGALQMYNTGGAATLSTSANVPVGQWTHIAAVKTSSTTGALFINGTSYASGTFSSATAVTNAMYIGSDGVANDALYGYIADFRITRGVARYTTTFTPPTTPHMLK